MSTVQRLVLWALGWMERYRYIKFGIVGASGTVVNLVVLHLGHEFLFNELEAAYNKPYFSLALAIAVATLNNFTWNRLWTWSDRVKTLEAEEAQPVSLRLLGLEFGQYITASAFGSGLQYVLTLLLSGSMDYRVANIIAIVAASVSNFLANDRWTFKRNTD
ncbi:GtrA family protein [Rhodoferax saidenbachensis]|uniref:Dolichol-phosphate mannosyltransferase n=1 Tax=Rhodoferax saidenbachensis TaxID=1484693 RepID=A0ABU1ZJL6_9BURK|nr:GtrA family protein [Rhodoferax saidenbachensis]MDR7305732.1 dolichol-phosphate mannosyltransferase [Rhodoferax saidenbachensis]